MLIIYNAMLDHSTWKQTEKLVTSLQLDDRNPRLPPRSVAPAQIELLAELIKHENVYALAKDITEQGYYRVELPIAVEEGGKFVIVEGNRRLAALKLLISPDQAPIDTRSKFKKLSHKVNISQIKKIPIVIAPSRDAAAPVILRKHTRSQIESWSPIMQARFYADRIADGSTISDLAKDYSITPGEIADFLQNYHMYQIACNLELPPDVSARVNDPHSFPLTNLERIYRNADVATFLGITFDSNREIKGSIDIGEFKKAYRKIVTDVALGDVNSRKLNSADEFKKYIATFGKHAPDPTKTGKFTSSDLLKPTDAKGQSIPRKANTVPISRTKPQSALISKAFVSGTNESRINALIKELKKISVSDYPNAVALALRGLIDLTVGDYCDRIGVASKIVEHEHKKNKSNVWYPSVRQMLNCIISESKTWKVHPLALKAAQMLVADHKTVTVVTLDAFAHNKYVTPTESELRSFWTQIEEAMKTMLTPTPTLPDGGSK